MDQGVAKGGGLRRPDEEVAAVSDGPRWFQVYVWRDRGLVRDMVERARSGGYEALMLTVDSAVFGRRERDVRRGFELPPQIGLDTLVDGMLRPGWTWRLPRSEPIRFANVSGAAAEDAGAAVALAEYVNRQFDPSLSGPDLDWLRGVWDGPIVLKGIQTVENACLAAERGVDAIALSNHGGRQLDGAPAPLDLVAPVADAVGGRLAILCDGGVRRTLALLGVASCGELDRTWPETG